MPSGKPRVALFVTCLVDLHRPTVGFAAIRLLEQAGCQVEVPRAQTCCGQPAYNSGDRATTRDLAEGILIGHRGYSSDDAFGELVAVAHSHGASVSAIASALVDLATGAADTGETPSAARAAALSAWGHLVAANLQP